MLETCLHKMLGLVLMGTLISCTAQPSKDAVVANFIRALLAGFIEDNISILTQGGTNEGVPCGVSGTYDVGNPDFGRLDPRQPLDQQIVPSPVTYHSCVMKICGQTVTIEGSGLSVGMSVAQLSGAGEGGFTVQIEATELAITGSVLSGSLTFGYKLDAEVTTTSITDLTINELTTPNPLTLDGRTYRAEYLESLAEGC